MTNITAHIGERALEQLNYSLIKNRAWYVSDIYVPKTVLF